MTTKRIRSGALIACLLTSLLPTGAALAQQTPDPRLPADRLASVLTFGVPLSAVPYQLEAVRGDVPWFRKSFDLHRADIVRPMVPAAVEVPPMAEPELPGVVQNLRVVGRP